MAKAYLVFGTVVCLVFVYASYTGWSVWDSASAGQWGPQGQQGVHHK